MSNIFAIKKKKKKGVPLFGKGQTKPFGINIPAFGSAQNISKLKKLKKPKDIDVFPVRIPQKPKRDKDLNWTQASTKYRHLSPFADTDKDGIQNWQDCRPLNINMQGPLHDLQKWGHEKLYSKEKGKIMKGKRLKKKIKGVLKTLSSKEGELIKTGTPVRPTKAKEKARASKRLALGTLGVLGLISPQEQKTFSPTYRGKSKTTGVRGRPAGSYKYTIPGKGPVHVYEYRKWARRQRALKRLQREPEYEEFEGDKIQAPPSREEFEPEPQEQGPQE